MALKKSVEALGGQVTADYWKITGITLNVRGASLNAEITVKLFKDKDSAKFAPSLDEQSGTFVVPRSEFDGNIFTKAYELLKAEEFFTGSEDA